jgi:hypothetical protein
LRIDHKKSAKANDPATKTVEAMEDENEDAAPVNASGVGVLQDEELVVALVKTLTHPVGTALGE